MLVEKAILIGFGHHGRKRLYEALLKLEQIKEILICDKNSDQFSNLEIPTSKQVSTTDDINEVYVKVDRETLIVIGTTAKDHLELVRNILAKGAQFVYLEKPLAQSLSQSLEIAALIKSNNAKIAVGFYNDFFSIIKKLDQYVEDYQLGRLLKITSAGGAVGLSSVGLHVIDLATLLFNSEPNEVYGKVNTWIANPRGEEYKLSDGLGYVIYKDGQELILNYNNNSRNSHDITLHFEYGYIQGYYFGESFQVMGFENVDRDKPKYLYQIPKQLASIPNEVDFVSFFEKIFTELLSGESRSGIDRAISNMKVLFGILLSNELKKPLSFPLDVDEEMKEKIFPIT